MKLLLTGAFPYTREQMERLRRRGFDISFIQNERDPLTIRPEEVEVVVCNGLFLYHDISLFTNLSAIHLTSAGTDRVPVDYIQEKGIQLYRAEGVYSIPMAEWVILKLLEIYKNSHRFYYNQMNRKWEKERGLLELPGKRAAIIGYGSVGKEVAKRLRGFGLHITGLGRRAHCTNEELDEYHRIDQLENVLAKSDIAILTLPLSNETRHLFDEDKLSMMKERSVLINVSRGGIIDEKALAQALREGRFLGVALDVFEQEPLPEESPLWDMDEVLVTPHNSFVSDRTQQRLFDLIETNLTTLSKNRDCTVS
ncbi:NAD(P)-dependent oxidoreductase [Salimicrobium halophilum]|uniref:Phosphoglycerate dehydrogenase n=1 Tax=Salimicrobium halophilum TaxID=86666 RepID=A0A1G8SBT7_9BACI|nr:NAD(P)-dependent oxidoreductase [Salimicrobium halophilum]SDJ26678.1 Phosphoglycerate dehydrogenase [Salimicrobium halophilum]